MEAPGVRIEEVTSEPPSPRSKRASFLQLRVIILMILLFTGQVVVQNTEFSLSIILDSIKTPSVAKSETSGISSKPNPDDVKSSTEDPDDGFGEILWPMPTKTCTLLVDPVDHEMFVFVEDVGNETEIIEDIGAYCHIIDKVWVTQDGPDIDKDVCRKTIPKRRPLQTVYRAGPTNGEPSSASATPFSLGSIGVVSAIKCRNAKILVGTSFDKLPNSRVWQLDAGPSPLVGILSIIRYMRYHNLPLYFGLDASLPYLKNKDGEDFGERGPYFAKLPNIMYGLERHSTVMWVDTDVLMPNLGITVEQVFHQHIDPNATQLPDMMVQQSAWINTNTMIFRKTPWTGRFFRIMWQDSDNNNFPEHPMDQTAVQHTIIKSIEMDYGNGGYKDLCLASVEGSVFGNKCWMQYQWTVPRDKMEQHVLFAPMARAKNTDPAFTQLHCAHGNGVPLEQSAQCRGPTLVVHIGMKGHSNDKPRIENYVSDQWPDYYVQASCLRKGNSAKAKPA